MSKKYDLYLEQHKANVAKGFHWLRENLPELVENEQGLEWLVCYNHDASKSELDEYVAYDAYFYGGNRSYEVVNNFNHAWLRHIHRNPHHWQYWILQNDNPDEGMVVLDMEYRYIIEMICDWLSFSISKGDMYEIFNWYDKRKDYMKLSNATRKTVEDILGKIQLKLTELEEKEQELNSHYE